MSLPAGNDIEPGAVWVLNNEGTLIKVEIG